MIYFKDEEIIVRDIIQDDITYLFSWNIDKELNAHDPKPIPSNSKELLKECTSFCNKFDNEIINENIDERKYKYFIITDIKDKPIGFINIFSIDKNNKQCEMGVIIGDKRYWKKGVAYKSLNAVIDYIFNDTDISRIYIETGETNTPALGLFEKLKFIRCDEYIEDENFKFIVMEKRKL